MLPAVLVDRICQFRLYIFLEFKTKVLPSFEFASENKVLSVDLLETGCFLVYLISIFCLFRDHSNLTHNSLLRFVN